MGNKYWKKSRFHIYRKQWTISILITFFFSFLTSCEDESYRINGFANDLNEGDTIVLAYNTVPERPLAKTIVSNGKFYFEEKLGDQRPCILYQKQTPQNYVFFFPDYGTIAIELHEASKPSRISGTKLNNTWQHMNDVIQHIGKELMRQITQQDSDSTIHLKRYLTVDSLHRKMVNCIKQTGQNNKDNPLGRFILQNYKEPEFN